MYVYRVCFLRGKIAHTYVQVSTDCFGPLEGSKTSCQDSLSHGNRRSSCGVLQVLW